MIAVSSAFRYRDRLHTNEEHRADVATEQHRNKLSWFKRLGAKALWRLNEASNYDDIIGYQLLDLRTQQFQN